MTRKRYAEPAVAVPPTEAAIITATGMTDLELVMPDLPDDGELPEAALFLVACAMRYHDDPEFVQAQLAWLGSHKGWQGTEN
jgi:hypothetical protein